MARRNVKTEECVVPECVVPESADKAGSTRAVAERVLLAAHSILYLSRQYGVGERLPANDPDMVKAWLDAETAIWSNDEDGIQND
ncbi:MAG: hypothetical protein RR593_08155 [Hungatella sp.]